MEILQQFWNQYWSFVTSVLGIFGLEAEYQFYGGIIITVILVLLIVNLLGRIFGLSSPHRSDPFWSSRHQTQQHLINHHNQMHHNAIQRHHQIHQNMVHRHNQMHHRH